MPSDRLHGDRTRPCCWHDCYRLQVPQVLGEEVVTSPVTLKGRVIAEIVAGNPGGRLKAVEYDSFGGIKRIEWHDDREPESEDA